MKDLPDRRDVAAGLLIRRDVVPADEPCPECGSPLFIDVKAERHDGNGRVRIVRAAFCSGCEFAHEF
jgi:hypothetical protein